jgi:hypothetical protein
MVDAFGGVTITLTTTSVDQTIAAPTATTLVRQFVVVNKSASTEPVVVGGTPIIAGSKVIFVWDGAAWINGSKESLLALTDPASGALTAAVVDKYTGVVITTTTTGATMTIADPSDAAKIRDFHVVLSSASTDVVLVNNNPIQIGEAVEFFWTGTEWDSDPLAIQAKSLLGSGRHSGLELSATLGNYDFRYCGRDLLYCR